MEEVSEWWRQQHAQQRGRGRLGVEGEIGEVVVYGGRSEGSWGQRRRWRESRGEEGGRWRREYLRSVGRRVRRVYVALRVRMGLGGWGEGHGLTARLMGVAILHFRPVFVLVGPRQNRNTGGGHGGRL